jgi:hypothetical protein
MSAYMVSDAHLNFLASSVQWGIAHRRGLQVVVPQGTDLSAVPERTQKTEYDDVVILSLTYDDAEWVKRVLHDANVHSLVVRYGDNPHEFEYKKFKFVHWADTTESYRQFLGALQCYSYQACEPRDWNKSLAHHIVQAMQSKMLGWFTEGYWNYNPEPPQSTIVPIEVLASTDTSTALVFADVDTDEYESHSECDICQDCHYSHSECECTDKD